LINNAAAPIGPFKLTVDNLESQTATDYIGPFLFTKLLAPKLLAASTGSYVPRVVFLSSYGHALMPELDLNKIVGKPDEAKYHPFYAYAHMKAASVLIAIELSKRSGGRINAYSLCPGRELSRYVLCGSVLKIRTQRSTRICTRERGASNSFNRSVCSSFYSNTFARTILLFRLTRHGREALHGEFSCLEDDSAGSRDVWFYLELFVLKPISCQDGCRSL
jgi:NAD(P)-dependent dehydrogenase (short-subunit alcohol dehydrogenase family)